MLRDDGAAVYLNGNEIYRAGLQGTINYDTRASGTSSESTYFPSGTLCESLNTGTNVLAVEVHQSSYGSSDVSFDLELIGVTSVPNNITRGPYLQNQTPTSITIRWSSSCPGSDSRVKWGSSAGNLTNTVDDATVSTDHEVEVTGLTPGATVFYSVGSTTQVLAGDDANHFFVMPPARHRAEDPGLGARRFRYRQR